jgi:hypothetical protein
MDDRLLTHTIMASVVIVAAIVAAQASFAPAGLGRAGEQRVTASSGPAPLIPPRYRGCPNGNCG